MASTHIHRDLAALDTFSTTSGTNFGFSTYLDNFFSRLSEQVRLFGARVTLL